uniref:Serine-threonine/tyrosine-protein kinase catalytic domain-containing protein n=1 Tax=Manihot esculenta TaxID=3983 RepID=A0A2C9U3P6_MANES
MLLQLFPVNDASNKSSHVFNTSEVLHIMSKLTGWNVPDSDIFGPYELPYFPLLDPYNNGKGALVGIILGAIAVQLHSSKASMKIDGAKDFTYTELALATNKFSSSTQVGQGGYGKGEKESLTEIELLSRLHHRNLVSLVGYGDEEGEQMLVYEFMSNGGAFRDKLSGLLFLPFCAYWPMKIPNLKNPWVLD